MLRTKAPIAITLTLGTANAIQIVRATIECPVEDQVRVVLDVQGSMVDDNGDASGVIPLPQVVLDAEQSAAVYAAIREVLYMTVKAEDTVPNDATLTALAVSVVTK